MDGTKSVYKNNFCAVQDRRGWIGFGEGQDGGGFQLRGAELGHLEVNGEESFVRADKVVGFCIDDDDAVFGAIPAKIG
jgi:hypothetical protein